MLEVRERPLCNLCLQTQRKRVFATWHYTVGGRLRACLCVACRRDYYSGTYNPAIVKFIPL